jgi:hypothetical protein
LPFHWFLGGEDYDGLILKGAFSVGAHAPFVGRRIDTDEALVLQLVQGVFVTTGRVLPVIEEDVEHRYLPVSVPPAQIILEHIELMVDEPIAGRRLGVVREVREALAIDKAFLRHDVGHDAEAFGVRRHEHEHVRRARPFLEPEGADKDLTMVELFERGHERVDDDLLALVRLVAV